jgi:hypothetical protein
MSDTDTTLDTGSAAGSQRPAAFAVLAHLESVALPTQCEQAIEELRRSSQGTVVWRARKAAEARDLFALAEIAERMNVLALQGETELRALVRLRAPVPCMPPGTNELIIGEDVDLVLHYPEEIMHRPLPGYRLVEILRPRDVLMPNVARGPNQLLCLGANVPRNFPLREAVMASYGALTMQAVTIDERDTAGIMNPIASEWWKANASRIPLSKEPFLAKEPFLGPSTRSGTENATADTTVETDTNGNRPERNPTGGLTT